MQQNLGSTNHSQGGFIPDIVLWLSYFYTGSELPIRLRHDSIALPLRFLTIEQLLLDNSESHDCSHVTSGICYLSSGGSTWLARMEVCGLALI